MGGSHARVPALVVLLLQIAFAKVAIHLPGDLKTGSFELMSSPNSHRNRSSRALDGAAVMELTAFAVADSASMPVRSRSPGVARTGAVGFQARIAALIQKVPL